MPRRYHWKAMECPRRVNINWVKGAEVYLFCTQEKGANPGTREKSYHLVWKESSTPKQHLKRFLKSFNAAEAAWSRSLENYDFLRICKGSSFRMAEFLYAKSVIWLFFYIACVREKTHERCSSDLFWSLKWLGMTGIGFLVKNEPWFEDEVQFLLLQNFKCTSIG